MLTFEKHFPYGLEFLSWRKGVLGFAISQTDLDQMSSEAPSCPNPGRFVQKELQVEELLGPTLCTLMASWKFLLRN